MPDQNDARIPTAKIARWQYPTAGCLLAVFAGVMTVAGVKAEPLQTGITYQGMLRQSAAPAEGTFDFEFRLFDVAENGLEIVPVIAVEDVSVSEGLFSVELDFAAAPYAGDQLWLQVSVRDGDSNGGYTQLLPRQKVTAVPYALHAEMVALGAVSGPEIADGTVGAADIAPSEVQLRVTQICPAGSAIRSIDSSGGVSCETDDDTVHSAGEGIEIALDTISVAFAGDGAASTAARSDHLHDSEYGSGDLIVSVIADGTPTENGNKLLAALGSITDAGAERPYTLLLSGGHFELPAGGLALKPYVSLRGRSRTSTLLEAPGDGVDFTATLSLNEQVSVENVTVINTGGAGTTAIGILGLGEQFEVRDVDIRVSSNSASEASGFTAGTSSAAVQGILSRVSIEVDTGYGIGHGTGFGDVDLLEVRGSHVLVTGAGTGVADPGLNSGGRLLLRDTVVEVRGGGVGFAVTASNLRDDLVLDDVEILVDGGSGANYGLYRAGSTFRVLVRSSLIQVAGSFGSAAVRFSNGRVTLQGTQLVAPIGLAAISGGSFAGSLFVDNSVFDVTTAVRVDGGGTGSHNVWIGSSKLDASNNIVEADGMVDAVCVNVHDENYLAVGSDCL